MVTKIKAKAAAAPVDNNQLAAAVKDSAHQIWLAGLGAFAKAQEEGSKVFEALVKEGTGLHRKTREMTESRLGDVTGKVSKAAGDFSKQATEGWDKLESVFEDRVARALHRMGVPTSKDVQELMARVDALNANVQALSGKSPAKKTRKANTQKVSVISTKAPAKRAARKARKAV